MNETGPTREVTARQGQREQVSGSPFPTPNPRGRGLGRGLGALIPQGDGGSLEVDVDRIAPNPRQPRYVVDDAALGELADSIRQHGVLQPLIVTRGGLENGGHGHGETYTLIAGERRWRAAREAGLRTVPVVVKEATPRQRLELALVENLQRQDLNPLETAQAYRQLVDEHGLTQEAVAERVGKNRATVANALRLLHLPPEARDALACGAISEGHARAILACLGALEGAGPVHAGALLRAILERGLSVRQAEELARRLNNPSPDPLADAGLRGLAPDMAALEERFRRVLGTNVQLYRGRRGGKIVVYFTSDDELRGLYDAICGAEADPAR